MSTADRGRVHLAASGGGHLELLLTVRESLGRRPRTWITTPGPKAEALRRDGERVLLVPPLDRRNLNLGNPAQGIVLAARERPRVVLTSGAGVVATFALAAKALGARLIFAETMARVASGSATGRAMAHVVDEFFVQWPQLLRVYPRATLCKPVMLDDIAADATSDGHGTFVAVGSHPKPFARLLAAVEQAATKGLLPRPVLVQSGTTSFSSQHALVERWISESQFDQHVRRARYVVCHGGAAVIAAALRAGRRPLVMTRSAAYGEHVDEHQGELVGELQRRRLVVSIEERITAGDLASADAPWPQVAPWHGLPDLRDAMPKALEIR